jgi:ankyrin repeat protein
MENKESNEKLMTAVIRGDIDMAIEALQSGASIHTKTTKGNNLLYVAASRMHEDMFDWLLEVEQGDKKIDLNTQNNMGATTLMDFVREDGFLSFTKKLLKAGANPNIPTNDGMSPLIQACADKKLDEVQALLDAKVDINYAIKDTKTTAFLMAASQSSMSICEVLKESGADVNAMDSFGKNALITAIFKTDQFMKKKEKTEHKALCIFLSDIGIDVNYVAPSGLTALWAASAQRNKELVEHLLNKGVNANVWHEIGLEGKMSALHIWVNSKETALVKRLVECGAELNTQDENGNTVAAIGFANPIMRELMLELGADVNAKFTVPKSHPSEATKQIPAITLVIQGGNKQKEIVKKMIDAGAKVSFEEEQAYEPIMAAINNSAYDIVKDLLDTKQIDVNRLIKINQLSAEMTPLMLAVSGAQNQKFDAALEKKAQYEAILKAKEENDKNGVKSTILDDDGIEAIKKELEEISTLEGQLDNQKKQIFDTLINYGAKVDVVNEDGRSAIFMAAKKDFAQWLKDAGANLYLEDKEEINPLVYAVLNNKNELAEFLKVEYTKNNDKTIENIFYQLAFAPIESSLQQTLLERGVINYVKNEVDMEKFKEKETTFNVSNINYQDEDGNSPLLVACANNVPFLASLYLKLGADINLANANDETPLMHAISTGNEQMVEYLVEHGANSNIQTKDGKTVLEFAEECNNKEILEKVKISLGHGVAEGSISGIKKLKP